MGDYPDFMGRAWLLCGVDFLSKLQPNSGLEHAIGDADSSPKPIRTLSAPENRAAHHSHTCLDASRDVDESPNAPSLIGGSFCNVSRASIALSSPPSYQSSNVRHPLTIDKLLEFFPQLRHKARPFTNCDGWNFGMSSSGSSNRACNHINRMNKPKFQKTAEQQ